MACRVRSTFLALGSASLAPRPLWWCSVRAASSKATSEDSTTTSKRRQFKQTPIDPKLYQHLERLGLGWVSRSKSRVPKGAIKVPERPDPQKIPYFQKNQFRQGKRALRQEKKRVERQLVNLHRAGLLRTPKSPSTMTTGRPRSEGNSSDEVEKKRSPFSMRAKTRLASVQAIEDIPPPIPGVPELAIIGRSNVGKSTLLNSVLGIRSKRKAAAVDDRPGVTQSLDFYVLGPRDRPAMVVVDMPGYGFAFANEEKKEQWQTLMLHYLKHPRRALKRILMLLDARHGFKLKDREFIEELYSTSDDGDDTEDAASSARVPSSYSSSLSSAIPPRLPKLQIVLTKCDMVTREDLARRAHVVMKQLSEVLPRETRLPVLMVSANKGQGVQELRKDLAALIPPQNLVPPPQEERKPGDDARAAGGSSDRRPSTDRKPPTPNRKIATGPSSGPRGRSPSPVSRRRAPK